MVSWASYAIILKETGGGGSLINYSYLYSKVGGELATFLGHLALGQTSIMNGKGGELFLNFDSK